MTEHHCPTGYHTAPALTCYTNHHCRCPNCREHARKAKQKQRTNKPRQPPRKPKHPPNNAPTGHNCWCGHPDIIQNGKPTCAVYGKQHQLENR